MRRSPKTASGPTPQPMDQRISVQLYTVREDTARDFPGTLRQLAEMGIAGVEFAGYGSEGPDKLRQVIDELGLVTSGAHVALNRLEGELDTVIEELNILGARHVACPFLPPERRQTADDYRRIGEQLSRIGGRLRAAGIQLSFHNHDMEFQQLDGRFGIDILYEAADPRNLNAQFDLGWIDTAGQDPAAYLRKYSGRVPTVHFKDMAPGRKFVPLGQGNLKVPELIDVARECGSEWLIVEQDRTEGPALEAVRQSVEYLKSVAFGRQQAAGH